MSDCRFGVSPVNYPDPDPDISSLPTNFGLGFCIEFTDTNFGSIIFC